MNYPEHCIGCKQFEACKQKEYMLAVTEPVEGWVDFDLCDNVCEVHRTVGNMDENLCNCELDSPAHCFVCGRPLECRLTDAGINYVKEAIAEGGGCCRELWPVLFVDYL